MKKKSGYILLLVLFLCSVSFSAKDKAKIIGNTTIKTLINEAKLLKAQSDKLYEMAEKLVKESKNLQENAEELEKDSEDLEDRARALLRQADRMEETIKLSRRAYKKLQEKSGDQQKDTTASNQYLEEQKNLLLKMRSNADELLVKAKKIALSVREMAEQSDKKKNMADDLNDNAEKLEIKAKDLKEASDSLEEDQ